MYRYGSVGRSIKPFFTFTDAQWQKEDIVMKHYYNPSFLLSKLNGPSLPNSSADTCCDVDPGMETPSCTKKEVGLSAIRFGPQFLQLLPVQLTVHWISFRFRNTFDNRWNSKTNVLVERMLYP